MTCLLGRIRIHSPDLLLLRRGAPSLMLSTAVLLTGESRQPAKSALHRVRKLVRPSLIPSIASFFPSRDPHVGSAFKVINLFGGLILRPLRAASAVCVHSLVQRRVRLCFSVDDEDNLYGVDTLLRDIKDVVSFVVRALMPPCRAALLVAVMTAMVHAADKITKMSGSATISDSPSRRRPPFVSFPPHSSRNSRLGLAPSRSHGS
jgi:hypothetical protein